MKKLTILFIFGVTECFSQNTFTLPNTTTKSAFLSHEALMDKILKRTPKEEKTINFAKSNLAFSKGNISQKSLKILAPAAYCNCSQTPLSVQEIDLKATRINNENVQLNWKTTGEKNSQGFDIERSNDLSKFTKLGFIPAKNSTENKNDYEWIDTNNLETISYYRIKETDLNGKITYSKIVAINGGQAEEIVLLYPNPASDEIQLKINSKNATNAKLEILSTTGKIVFNQKVNLNTGLNTIKNNISDFAPGIYIMKIAIFGEKSKLIKFIKN